jgi:hypothetical protein
MEYDRKFQLIGNFKLPDEPLFLNVSRRKHSIKIKADFSPGTNTGTLGKVLERLQDVFIATFCVVGMNPHGSIHPWYGFRDGDPLGTTFKSRSNGHGQHNARLMHTMDDIIQIFVIGPVVQMTVTVKKSHEFNLLDILQISNIRAFCHDKIHIEMH